MLRGVFVPPPGYAAARRLLTAGRIVVVGAPARHGGRTAALSLLTQQGCEVIIAVEPTELDELHGLVFAPRHGYLVDGVDADRLTPGFLGGLTDRLAGAGAHLVMVVEDADALRDDVRRVHAVHIGRADATRVVRRHLVWALGLPAGAHAPLVAGLPWRELVAPATPPPHAAHAAVALAEVIGARSGSAPTGTELLATVRHEPEAALDHWFAEHTDPTEVAFLIAAAVFEGCDYDRVDSAAERLAPRLAPPGASPPGPLEHARHTLLDAAGAHTVAATETGTAARYRMARVRFTHPDRASAVLRHVWREYRRARPLLLDWLLDSCDGADIALRARVGKTVGQLISSAGGHDVVAVLDRWAGDPRPWVRALTARALGAAARERIAGTQVRARMAGWLASTDARRAEVAVRVYGGDFGRIRPSVAFDRLEHIARLRPELRRTVAASLAELLCDGELSPTVLTLLERWYDDAGLAETAAHTVIAALTHPDALRSPDGATPDSATVDAAVPDSAVPRDRQALGRAARGRLADWRRGGALARTLLVRVLDDHRSHVAATRALWEMYPMARTDPELGAQLTAIVGDLLRPPATDGLRWFADDLADRLAAEPPDDLARDLLRTIRGFRALDADGPVVYEPESMAGHLLLSLRFGLQRHHALVLLGRDGSLTAERPGVRGVRLRDVLLRRYRAAYRVRLAEWAAAFPIDLPGRSVDVRVTWQTSDPAQVVKRRLRNASGYVHRAVEARVRRIAAACDGDLHGALHAELTRRTELPEVGLCYAAGRVWVPDPAD